jgi:chemotaxis protein MotB
VKRSTSIIRVLTDELGVKPSQLIAAGRSSYVPLVNDNAENRARNRRTRIVVSLKLTNSTKWLKRNEKLINEASLYNKQSAHCEAFFFIKTD